MILTRRMQIQIIADTIAGLQPVQGLDQFEEYLKAVYQVAQTIRPDTPDNAKRMILKSALKNRRDADLIVDSILQAKPGSGGPRFDSLFDISDTLPPIKWLWRNWIPRGMVSLLGAMKGAGKTAVALDLSNRLLKNSTFPDGQPVKLPDSKVVYVDAELIPQIINERARVWQMDTRRFHLMLSDAYNPIDFTTARDRDTLVEMVYSIKPDMVVLDSFGSLNSKGENAIEDVRELMTFFVKVSIEFQIAIVINHHLRKRSPLSFMDLVTLDDFRGSGHIVQMARSVMALSIIQNTPTHDYNGPRRFEIVSTNLCRYPDPLGIEFLPLEPEGVLLRYDNEPPQSYREPTKRDLAKEWLIEMLQGSEISPDDLVQMAKKQIGISRETLYRAHADLQKSGVVVDTLGYKDPANKWKLTGAK